MGGEGGGGLCTSQVLATLRLQHPASEIAALLPVLHVAASQLDVFRQWTAAAAAAVVLLFLGGSQAPPL